MVKPEYLLICMLTASVSVAAETTFLCTVSLTSGPVFDMTSRNWVVGSDTTTVRYAFKPDDFGDFAVTDPANGNVIAYCPREFNEDGGMVCGGQAIEFSINRDSLRFQMVRTSGYVLPPERISQGQEGREQPSIAIGKCVAE